MSYPRRRRWRLLVAETLFALTLFLLALWTSSHVFLKLLQPEPARPLGVADIAAALPKNTILGYAPKSLLYEPIMDLAAKTLNKEFVNADSIEELNKLLLTENNGSLAKSPVIWVMWQPKEDNVWKFTIKSNERTKYLTNDTEKDNPLVENPHLLSGFLAVQVAVSQAIVEVSKVVDVKYDLLLAAMPVSPLMKQQNVRDAVGLLLACFTLAMLPPVLETEALVVKETSTGFKRALRIYEVDYATMYLSWLAFAGMTITPICILAAITLILIFRWIHILVAMLLIMAYTFVMLLMSLIMAIFHEKVPIALAWTVLFTITQTMLAELLVNHGYDQQSAVLTVVINTVIPPMGLIHGLNTFAMLQTGSGTEYGMSGSQLAYMIVTWISMIVIYFLILMLFQRCHNKAIGGKVHWKTIIFKKKLDKARVTAIGQHRDVNQQKVDELVPKAISFQGVSKTIMNNVVLNKVYMDIYRNEFSLLFTQRYQTATIGAIEDLIMKLSTPDEGSITILGNSLADDDYHPMTRMYNVGFCHQPEFLIDELNVQEMLNLLISLCLWRESSRFIWEYSYLRSKYLTNACGLHKLRYQKIGNLGVYYKTHLCWAIALMLEPKIVIVSEILSNPGSVGVIIDKMMQYKKSIAILNFSHTYTKMEYADRVFLFDRKILTFGGTPAFMFYKYGRDYRIRISFMHGCEEEKKLKVIAKIYETGATIRCYFGSLLIMKIPTNPSEVVAKFIKDLELNKEAYGIRMYNVAVPDPDEIYKRAIHEGRKRADDSNVDLSKHIKLRDKFSPWFREKSNKAQFKMIGIKFLSFYISNKHVIFLTTMSAIVTGICFGYNMSQPLMSLEKDLHNKNTQGREVLSVESRSMPTTLIMRISNDSDALAIANAYVLSTTNAKKEDAAKITYTSISSTSLSEYLITKVIDSPQLYVKKYAYGIHLRKSNNNSIRVKVLYSPYHEDRAAAARAAARAFMALLRFYCGHLDADIQVTDHPIGLDLTDWVAYNTPPPLLVHLLLVFTIAHVIIIPSKENGFIKFYQVHATDFSPFKYWGALFAYDVALYSLLVLLMTAAMLAVFLVIVPARYAASTDLWIITLLLFIYGITCIPQAYLFTLFGRNSTLNSMIYIIMNIVLGEATIVFRYFYGGLSQANFMVFSPQYNMAYAMLKVKLIFFSNNECKLIHANDMCVNNTLNKCCKYCGVLQPCFEEQHYLSMEKGVSKEIITIVSGALFFITLLMFIEYKQFRTILFYFRSKFRGKSEKTYTSPTDAEKPGPVQEIILVKEKLAQLKDKGVNYNNAFGDCLIAHNVMNKSGDVYELRRVTFGLQHGDALALTGRIHHGRLALCNILSGYKRPTRGNVIAMERWKLMNSHHNFCRQISYCCYRSPLPPWMTVYHALCLLAALRGMPRSQLHAQVKSLLNLMDMNEHKHTRVEDVSIRVQARLHVIAAVLAAPPVVILDEAMPFQRFYIQSVAFYIMNELKNRGHALVIASNDVESQLPVTNKTAIMLDGYLYDIGNITLFKDRYGMKGYTVVVHLKDEIDAVKLFQKYFAHFVVNDVSDVLINCQVLDIELNIAMVFERMEILTREHSEVYSYIVTMVPIANLYNKIIKNEVGYMPIHEEDYVNYKTKLRLKRRKIVPKGSQLGSLRTWEPKFYLTSLKDLPWSVIFRR